MARILTVDDSASIRKIVAFYAQLNNHEAVEATNGAEGLEKLGAPGEFDLILTDINRPVMDGYEFIQRGRQLDAFKYTPVICLTTVSDEDNRVKAKDLGASGWLVKPFSVERLESLFVTLIGSK